MLNYRLATNSTVLPQQVPWQSILSPGVTLVFGFPNTPLTLGAGYQYGPKLREISGSETSNNSDPEVPAANSHLFQLRLSYDIPLLRIFGKH